MKTVIILSLFFILSGCGWGRQTETSENTAIIDTAETDGTQTGSSHPPETVQSSDAQEPRQSRIFRGLYISRNEVSTFRDCTNPESVYWLEDESKKLAPAYKKTTGYLAYPYESIYVEVKGYLKGKSNTGYAEEYQNVLIVTDLITSKQKSISSDCFAFEFIAVGNEPFWSLDIIPSEKIIALKDVGVEKTYVFPFKAAKVVGNTFTYQTTNDRKQTLKAIIIKEPCSDGMSDRKYNYSAQVTINGKTLKGCAFTKREKVVMRQ